MKLYKAPATTRLLVTLLIGSSVHAMNEGELEVSESRFPIKLSGPPEEPAPTPGEVVRSHGLHPRPPHHHRHAHPTPKYAHHPPTPAPYTPVTPKPYHPYVTAKALPKVLPVAPHPTAYPKALPSVKPHPVTAYPRHHSPAALPHAPVPTGPYKPRPTPPTAVAHSLPFKHHPKAAATPLYHHSPKPTPVYHLPPKPTPVYHHPEPKKPILPAPPQPVKPVLLPKPVAPHPKPVVPHPEPYHHPDPYHYDETPKNYAFGYAVKDDYTGDDFSHQESRDGYKTSGEYRVALPDGRIQIVTYHADENGYVADVKYEGVAHAPEPYHHAHPVNHAPAAIPQPAALPAAADLPLASRALPPSAPEPVPHHFKSPRPAALPQPIHNEVNPVSALPYKPTPYPGVAHHGGPKDPYYHELPAKGYRPYVVPPPPSPKPAVYRPKPDPYEAAKKAAAAKLPRLSV